MAQLLPDPQIVGQTFTDQYYRGWCNKPDELYRFYTDSSFLSRPVTDGSMTTVTTMQGINEVLSLGRLHNIEILRSDSQYARCDGVMVFVTGLLTGEDKIKRKFTQAFLLGYQGGPYYVLNDILRYVDDHEFISAVAVDSANEEAPAAETTRVVDCSADNLASPPQENVDNDDKVNHRLVNGKTLVAEEEVKVAVPESKTTVNDVAKVAENKASPLVEEEAPKMSYASMVNSLKENPNPFEVKYVRKVPKPLSPAPTAPKAPAPALAAPKAPALVKAAPKAPARAATTDPSSQKPVKIDYRLAKGYSVFVRNLPGHIKRDQVERIFKKYGNIKQHGVQVRGFEDQGSRFGFVEFVSLSSMEAAIKASPILIDDFEVTIEMKRQDNRNAGRPRGGYQNGNFQPCEGRGYGRDEFENQGRNGNNGNNARSRSSNGSVNVNSRDRGVYQNGGSAPQTARVQRN